MNTNSPTTFWTRLAQAIGVARRPERPAHDLPEVGDDGLLAEPAELPGENEVEPLPGRTVGPLARWAKRDQTLAKLQEGYEQVTELIEQIRNHLVTQADRSERLCGAIEQLARSMSDVPSISRQQSQSIEAIAAQLQAMGTRTQQLADSIGDLPKAARAQTETLSGIDRQLQIANEHSLVGSQTMDKLGTAITLLSASHHTQGEALRQMDAKAGLQNELLTQLIARQGRRFVLLFIVTVVLAATGISLGILGVVLHGR